LGKRKIKTEEALEREFILPGEGQVLGVVVSMLGYDRMLVKCFDGKQRLCRVRGKLKRRVWIRKGDIVLVAPWEFQDDRGDIIIRYTTGQVERLKKMGYIKEEFE